MSETITIVIPTKDNPEALKATLESIFENASGFKVIVIDASTKDESKLESQKWQRFYGDDMEVIYKDTETSIIAMVYGMSLAKGDVLLTHDDVIFPRLYKRSFLKELQKLSTIPEVGLVTSLNGGGVSGPTFLDKLAWAGTWCTYIPKSTIEKIGMLDDYFTTGEDIDYSYRIIKAGLKIALADFWVDHHRSNEKPQDKQMANTDIVKVNGDYFKNKHKLE